jgi:hypothetical protein
MNDTVILWLECCKANIVMICIELKILLYDWTNMLGFVLIEDG